MKVVACVFFLAWVAAAGEVWNKDPGKWTDTDIERILNASPWAQRATVNFKTPEDDQPPLMPLPGPAQAGMGGRGNVTDGKWWGVAKNPRNVPGQPDLSVLVRWDSALPVRLAMKNSACSETDAQNHYIITVVGLVPARSYHAEGKIPSRSSTDESDDNSDPVDARNPEPMLEGLMADSMLATPSRIALHPENVRLDPDTGALHFFFPRMQPITAADKDVIFETNFGLMRIVKRFHLKDMMYHGKLEL